MLKALKLCKNWHIFSFQYAHFLFRLAEDRYASQNSTKSVPSNHTVGNKVSISGRLFMYAGFYFQPSIELIPRSFGPFTITELIGPDAVKLYLPQT